MLGLDALILLRDKTSPGILLLLFPVRDAAGLLLHLRQRLSHRSGDENATGWMTLGQFSEIFFMLALPFFTKRFGIEGLTAGPAHGRHPLRFLCLRWRGTILHLCVAVPRHSAARVSYDFYYVTAYIYVDKSAGRICVRLRKA